MSINLSSTTFGPISFYILSLIYPTIIIYFFLNHSQNYLHDHKGTIVDGTTDGVSFLS